MFLKQLLLLFLLLALTTGAAAAGTITDLRTDCLVAGNGSCQVTQTVTIEFTGIEQILTIPLGANAKRASIAGYRAQKTVEDGYTLFQLKDDAGFAGSRTFTVTYTLSGLVSETDGEVILYDGAPILAVFFSSADGSTQGAGDVWMNDLPYLQKVDSPETEELVPNYYSVATFTAAEFKSLILAAKPDADLSGSPEGWIRDIVRNDSDYVASVTVGGVKLRGNDLRTILSLRSPSFTVEYKDNAFTFHVTGYGHGVGMSQYGANILAKQGLSAEEIVQHYFSNTTVGYYDG